MKSVLYLGCPPAERADTAAALSTAEIAVVWADTLACAQAELARHEMPVLLDLSRGAAPLQTSRELRQQYPNALLFAVVDSRRPDLMTEAVLAGFADVFARPLGGRRVATAIERELGAASRASGRAVVCRGDDLYHHSPSMREVMSMVAKAAGTRSGVLIHGEEGSGRRLVARSIHEIQPGPAAPFVSIDCASYSPGELDHEIFGVGSPRSHAESETRGLERIARTGRLHAALGGTLYLEHLADAPTRVQNRLSRILRDREAILHDTGAPLACDVRPTAGVDLAFDLAVQEGRIRDDLFRRLSVIRIDVPALRNRREDIPALANYFLREICRDHRLPPKTLSRPALSLISALPWRGNAAELRTVLDAVVTGLAGGRGIGLDDVLSHVRLDGGSVAFAGAGSLKQARAQFEREYIAAVLERHDGRISDAAKALGIQRTNLYRKMRTLRVSRKRRAS